MESALLLFAVSSLRNGDDEIGILWSWFGIPIYGIRASGSLFVSFPLNLPSDRQARSRCSPPAFSLPEDNLIMGSGFSDFPGAGRRIVLSR